MTEAYILRSTLADFLRFRRVFVWLLVIAGLFGMATIFLHVNPEMDRRNAYSLLSSILVFRLLPLASAIFSTAVVSQEVEQKTIVYLLTRPVARWKLLLFRTIASILVVALLGLIAAAVASVAVFGAEGLSNDLLLRDARAVLIGAAAYGALFVTVSLLINRAMIVCILYAFAWEISVGNMPGNMYWLSLSSYLTAVAERPSGGQMGTTGLTGLLAGGLGAANTLPAQTGWIVLGCLVALCLAFSAWWFTHFEYVPREDAE